MLPIAQTNADSQYTQIAPTVMLPCVIKTPLADCYRATKASTNTWHTLGENTAEATQRKVADMCSLKIQSSRKKQKKIPLLPTETPDRQYTGKEQSIVSASDKVTCTTACAMTYCPVR